MYALEFKVSNGLGFRVLSSVRVYIFHYPRREQRKSLRFVHWGHRPHAVVAVAVVVAAAAAVAAAACSSASVLL